MASAQPKRKRLAGRFAGKPISATPTHLRSESMKFSCHQTGKPTGKKDGDGYLTRSQISTGRSQTSSGRVRSSVPLVSVDDLVGDSKIIYHRR